jgi:hypothetical protein
MIVSVPEKWRERFSPGAPGSVNTELVNFIDFAPSMLSIAGAELPQHLQGRVIMGPGKEAAPETLFGHRDRMDERVDIIRVLIGQRYKYIRNFEYFKPRLQYQEYAEVNPWNGITTELRRLHETPGESAKADWFFSYKPVEELYDLQADPDEMHDLAGDPAHNAVLEQMRAGLKTKQQEIGDLGAIPEPLLRQWRQEYGSEYEIRTKAPQVLAEAWAVLDRLHILTADEHAAGLESDNAAVRYWSAIGLGNLAAGPAAHARIQSALKPVLEDTEVIVRIAAARGLLLVDDSAPALRVLGDIISDTSRDNSEHLAAMLAIDLAGQRAQPLVDTMLEAEFAKKYPRRVLNELLPRIEDAPARVPPLPVTSGSAAAQ